ncbi:unnamed protein product, partial [Heterotrigona itama]
PTTARGDETYERGRNSRKDGYQSRGRFAIRERALPVERVTPRQSYVSWESWPRRGYAAPRQGRDLEAATVDNARHLQALLEKEEVKGGVANEGVRKEYGRKTRRYREERATSFRCESTMHGKTLIQQRDTNQTAMNRGTGALLAQNSNVRSTIPGKREPSSIRSCDPSPVRWKINYTADGRLPERIFGSLGSKSARGDANYSDAKRQHRSRGRKKSYDRKSKSERDKEGRWNEFSCRNITRPIISYTTRHINSEHLAWQSGRASNHWNVNMVVSPTSKLNVPLEYNFSVVVKGHCNAFHSFFVPATNKMCLLPNCTPEQQQRHSSGGSVQLIL